MKRCQLSFMANMKVADPQLRALFFMTLLYHDTGNQMNKSSLEPAPRSSRWVPREPAVKSPADLIMSSTDTSDAESLAEKQKKYRRSSVPLRSPDGRTKSHTKTDFSNAKSLLKAYYGEI